ncbi:MAG TPA: glycosyltransferase family 4 protein, partial [Mycobacteriales bacterium]|nr:glycosyltransferase family 4 protein [Mycobacteriales bacterium]
VVGVATTASGPEGDAGDGVRVHRIGSAWAERVPGAYSDSDHRPHVPAPDPGVAAALRRLVAAERPDVVVAHNWIAWSYLAVKHADSPPLLWTLHDYSAGCHKRSRLPAPRIGRTCPGPRLSRCVACGTEQYGALRSAALATSLRVSTATLLRRAERIVAVSRAVAAAAEPVVERPVDVIPTALADGLADVARTTPRPDFLPAEPYLLFAGALGRHKGVHVLLDAHRRLGRRPPLVVLGTPRADQPQEWGPGVTVRTDVPHEQVMAAWRHALLGVVPSVWAEPWGHVAAEAATVGRAVVASRTGGLVDVVQDGVTGVLVPPGDPAALAAALQELLDDPDRRARMGAAGARRAESFTVSHITERVEQELLALVRRRCGRRVR